jgi:hypothetical protein
MHHLLQDVDQDKYGQVRVAIGAEDDEFFLETDHTIHCPNKNNRLTDEVEEMTHKEVKMLGLGLDGCGLILSKDNELVNHVRVPDNYAPLRRELRKYHTSTRKPVCPPSRLIVMC